MAGTEFQSKVLSQMDGSCFGGGVAECGIFASLSGNETCNGGCDDDSGWRFLGGFGCEKGKESGILALVLRDRIMLTRNAPEMIDKRVELRRGQTHFWIE